MSIYSKLILLFTTLITLLSFTIGFLAYRYATNVNSWQIQDKTITTDDLKENLEVSLVLNNGQVLDALLITDGSAVNSNVLGLRTTDGYIRVQIREGEMVIDPSSLNITSEELVDGSVNVMDLKDSSITSSKIIDATIGLNDTNFKVVSTINGISNNGGNIDMVGSNGIEISPDDNTNKITIKYNGNTILTNADTLDNFDSTFFRDISNQLTGSLSTDLYSSYDDLFKEGKLDFNHDDDLITKAQLSSNDMVFKNTTIMGDLSVVGDLIFDGALNYNILTLTPLNDEIAFKITNKDIINFSIDALGNIFTNGNLDIKGKITTPEFEDLSSSLLSTQDDISELSESLSSTQSDLSKLSSSIVGGVVICDHPAHEVSSLCRIYAPEGRVFKSLVITGIHSDIKIDAHLKEDPDGRNSVLIIVYPELAPANMHLQVSYLGILK